MTPQSTPPPAAPGSVVAVPSGRSASSTSTPVPHTPPPLDGVLPGELGGVQLHTFAVGQDILQRLAERLGIITDQLEVRYASEHGARFLQTYALRAPGTTASHLVEGWAAVAYPPDIEDAASSEQSVAGKTVTVVSAPSAAARLGTFYVYSSGDTLLVVQAFDPEVAAEALAALP